MATLRFTLCASNAHQTAASTVASASGEHTTSGTASFVEDGGTGGGTDIEAKVGQVFEARCDGDVWLAFNGQTAAVATTHFLPSGTTMRYSVGAPGKVSVIDDS